jgi:RHS repeat-associated protein
MVENKALLSGGESETAAPASAPSPAPVLLESPAPVLTPDASLAATESAVAESKSLAVSSETMAPRIVSKAGAPSENPMSTTSTSTTTSASSTTPIAVYLYAGDQIIENVTAGIFYYQDSLGNTSHVTDAVGNLLERYTYSAFGTPTFYNAAGAQISASAYGIRHLFQGQLWTQETGLNDYRNRVALPTMGVFLQPDPIGFKGDAANLYRFCTNNAVNRTDPLGLVGSRGGFSPTDWFWDMARHSDSANTWQGNFQDYMDRRYPAGISFGLIDQNKEGENKGGLKVRYAKSYPVKGPGGKAVAERALAMLKDTERGRFFKSLDAQVEIVPTDADHRTGVRGNLRNFRLYLNPNDDRFYDNESYRAFAKFKGELPPATDAGRATILAHEFGHGLLNALDENRGGRNVRDNENPVRLELGIPPRRSYGGHQFPLDD